MTRTKFLLSGVVAGLLLGLLSASAFAQVVGQPPVAPAASLDSLLSAGESSVTGRILQMTAALTLLSVAPALLIMMTSFTRFVIAFSFVRSGLGLQSTPPNIVLITLALFMTLYIMGPTFDRAWLEGVKPLLEKRITETQAAGLVIAPFEDFMRANVRDKDLKLFEDLEKEKIKAEPSRSKLRVLIPAFIVSELRRGFEIGFLILLPFLVIDLIVATLVMSMGMMMLSPSVFSLPAKILFFVLIDGWHLLVGGLVRSFV